jgi:crotonobetainyl-CoA:carnitine CoA-transferase CaiB-like acyl-CoA transferase
VQFETENRNKRSLALDLKNPAAKEIVHRLVRNSRHRGRRLPPGWRSAFP